MALYFSTSDPEALLKKIKNEIDEERLTFWSYDDDGDFTLTLKKWMEEAWLRPSLEKNRLRFSILSPKDTKISSAAYGVYHGYFISAVLTYCDDAFDQVVATALPDSDDRVSDP